VLLVLVVAVLLVAMVAAPEVHQEQQLMAHPTQVAVAVARLLVQAHLVKMVAQVS
jgi:hypothetical protein